VPAAAAPRPPAGQTPDALTAPLARAVLQRTNGDHGHRGPIESQRKPNKKRGPVSSKTPPPRKRTPPPKQRSEDVRTPRPRKKKLNQKEMQAVVRARLLRERVPALTSAQAKTLAEGLPTPSDPLAMSWPELAEYFAQIVLDGWSPERAVELGQRYVKAPGTRPVGEWMRIAGQLVDKPDAAAAFARMGGGWSLVRVADLAAEFDRDDGGGGGGRQALWARIGAVGGHLRDQPDEVAAFARLRGWNRDNVVALAGLYAAAPNARPARDWVALAAKGRGLANHENDVAAFAGVHGHWTQAGLLRLAGVFAANAGGRTAADWAALAAAHAMFDDRELVVAAAARAGWAALAFGQVATAGLAATATPLALANLLTTRQVATQLQAMIAAGWAAADVGTFAGTLLALGVGAKAIDRCLGEAGHIAATVNMRASWAPAQLAGFIRGAILEGTDYAVLTTLMASASLPASSNALIAGTWTAAHVGQFCSRAATAGATGLVIHGLCSTANAGLGLRAMTAANWRHGDLGTFAATVIAGPTAAAALVGLMRQAPFPRGSKRMHDAHWRPRLNAEFVVGALNSVLPNVDLANLVDEANFAANSHRWLAPGWTAREIGQIAAKARLQTLTAARLTTFLGTANAAATAHTLHTTVPAWTADEMGETIGWVRTRTGPPTDAELERLLFRAQTPIRGAQIQPLWLRTAANALRGGGGGRIPPTWANVIAQTPTFQANWAGPRANGNGNQTTWGSAFGAYNIRLRVVGERINHVEKGHTYEYFDFSYANCTRAGVGENGTCSMLGPGTNVRNVLNGLLVAGAVRTLAENAAWNATHGGGFPTQGVSGAYTVACASMAAYNGTCSAIISQCYPNGGGIVGRDLVAIGRFFGRFA